MWGWNLVNNIYIFKNNFVILLNFFYFFSDDIKGKTWYSYVDPDVTLDQLKKLTSEFLAIFEKCPSKLKKKILQSHNEVKLTLVLIFLKVYFIFLRVALSPINFKISIFQP